MPLSTISCMHSDGEGGVRADELGVVQGVGGGRNTVEHSDARRGEINAAVRQPCYVIISCDRVHVVSLRCATSGVKVKWRLPVPHDND